MRRCGPRNESGQALVEFSLVVTLFLVLLMSAADVTRGIYMYNGVAEAAREIARVTSVHPGMVLGDSTQTADVVSTQRGLVPGLASPSFACVDITGAPQPPSHNCVPGDWVKVTVQAIYTPVTPILSLAGSYTMQSVSTIQIQCGRLGAGC